MDSLALWLDIEPSSVVRIIRKILPELWRFFHNQIVCPNLLEWNNMMGNLPEISQCGRRKRIYGPLTDRYYHLTRYGP